MEDNVGVGQRCHLDLIDEIAVNPRNVGERRQLGVAAIRLASNEVVDADDGGTLAPAQRTRDKVAKETSGPSHQVALTQNRSFLLAALVPAGQDRVNAAPETTPREADL